MILYIFLSCRNLYGRRTVGLVWNGSFDCAGCFEALTFESQLFVYQRSTAAKRTIVWKNNIYCCSVGRASVLILVILIWSNTVSIDLDDGYPNKSEGQRWLLAYEISHPMHLG